MARKMNKTIYTMVERANKAMQNGTLAENEKLFQFVSNTLLAENMYHGFNFYQKLTIDGHDFLALCGNDKEHLVDGHFQEKQTDIRQFYLR